MAYEKALVATGSYPYIPPIKNADSRGVFALRSIGDLDKFRHHIKDNKKVVVIGGGLLGLDTSYSIKKAGCEVHVIENYDHILGKQLDDELSYKLERILNETCIETHTGKNTSKILLDNGKVSGIKFDDGEKIKANTIIIQARVRNDLELAKKAVLKLNAESLQMKGLKQVITMSM